MYNIINKILAFLKIIRNKFYFTLYIPLLLNLSELSIKNELKKFKAKKGTNKIPLKICI